MEKNQTRSISALLFAVLCIPCRIFLVKKHHHRNKMVDLLSFSLSLSLPLFSIFSYKSKRKAKKKKNDSYMKSSPQSIRPSIFRITRPTLRKILLILFNQNLLSSNRIIHFRFEMRRKQIEEIVKDTSGDEGVNVSNGEQVLPTNGDTGGGAAGFLNIVHEARKRRDTTEEECDDCAPVGTEFGRVSVDAVEIVHVGDGDVGFSYEEIAGAQVSDLFFFSFSFGLKERQNLRSTYSVMSIEVIGPRKMVYPPRKAMNLAADARIFHGTKAQLPITAAISWPRRMLMYLGQKAMRSLAAEMEFAAFEFSLFRPTITSDCATQGF